MFFKTMPALPAEGWRGDTQEYYVIKAISAFLSSTLTSRWTFGADVID